MIITITTLLIAVAGFKIWNDKPIRGKIESELIPYKMHGINVRSRVDQHTWTKIAHKAHEFNQQKFHLPKESCEVCKSSGKSQGFNHSLEAHEEWAIDTKTNTQKLMRIRSLCPLCHKVIHIGLAERDGYLDMVMQHMMKVNGWSKNEAKKHIAQAKAKVKKLNKQKYKLDLTLLNSYPFNTTHQYRFTNNETDRCKKGVFF